jgi:hypothetical protein
MKDNLAVRLRVLAEKIGDRAATTARRDAIGRVADRDANKTRDGNRTNTDVTRTKGSQVVTGTKTKTTADKDKGKATDRVRGRDANREVREVRDGNRENSAGTGMKGSPVAGRRIRIIVDRAAGRVRGKDAKGMNLTVSRTKTSGDTGTGIGTRIREIAGRAMGVLAVSRVGKVVMGALRTKTNPLAIGTMKTKNASADARASILPTKPF